MLILEAEHISRSYGKMAALKEFSLQVAAGETVGLTGLSGSGKSTCARVLAGLERPDTGVVRYAGRELTGPDPGIQMIFQDPAGSFNPVRTIYQSLSAVLSLQGVAKSERRDVLSEHFRHAGLQTEILSRYPDQISGGQAQRVAIVRGMIVQPKVMILDEPTSALDVSVQAQILHLLKHIQEEYDMAYVFISHDPSVVAFMADRVIGI
ncbi:MAG: dipeptide/oligopeptide/nickel ABC transporter ATP-binding protein [Methanocorpusculum sp.]|uniref:ABC transporter ATP-binding protein n=1 Tax=Methanocorpusculum sp. TaxID=2058474 RepID=UPI002725697C|nr:dipeptide/oligopeptide/nickel ABC transporter ATP-binding protein [Methanocorpusculum sp.]MDO9522868.1 dipeptide/oligopeptide/nickel ABC transporter ATP-binding protein [Methanocorpusculum sp.]